MVRADTLECLEEDCEGPPPSALTRRAGGIKPTDPFVTRAEWQEFEQPESPFGIGQRYFVPSRSSPRRGAELGYFVEIESSGYCPPVYFVDRDRGTRKLICGPEGDPGPNLYTVGIEVFGDFLAATCDFGRWKLVDISTGRDIADSLEWEDPVWVPAPGE